MRDFFFVSFGQGFKLAVLGILVSFFQSELLISQVINLGVQPHKYEYVFGHINIIIVDTWHKTTV